MCGRLGAGGDKRGPHLLQLPLGVLDVQGRRLPLMLAHQLEQVERRHPHAAQEQSLLSCCVLDLDPLGFLENARPASSKG